jgi:hypothetical protein
MIGQEINYATNGSIRISDILARLLDLGDDGGISLTYHDTFVAIEIFKKGRKNFKKRETLGGCEIHYSSFDPEFKRKILGD